MSILAGKNIVVIGGTSGIGYSATKAFIAAGASVVVAGRDEEKARSVTRKFGGNTRSVCGDAGLPGLAQQAVDLCLRDLGPLHGLYHVAGGSGRRYGDGPLHDLTLEGWNATIQWNLTSLMLSNQAAVRAFIKAGTGGSILNMGSVLGFSPSPGFFYTHAYAACKSAVIGFSKSIAAYYAKENIRVNVVAPAVVETPMAQRAANDTEILDFLKTKQPLDHGRIGQPSDVDGIAVYFMSDQSKFTTGQVIAVDGGWSVAEGQYT